MNSIGRFLEHPLTLRLGWTLLHSIWQEVAIIIALAAALACLWQRTPQARYVAACAALAAMLLVPCATFGILRPAHMKAETVGAVRLATPAKIASDTPQAAPDSTAALVRNKWKAQAGAMRGSSPVGSLAEPPAAANGWLYLRFDAQIAQSLLPWAVLLWCAGVTLLTIRLLGGWLYAHRLKSRSGHTAPHPWKEILNGISLRMGVHRVVRLIESGLVQTPVVIGWLKPIILVPASALTGFTPEQLESILAHELAHIRRHDYLVNLIQNVIETLLFYHPAVWWVSHRIRIEREHCCDDAAMEVCGDPLVYARALARLEEFRANAPALSLAASGGSLLNRIRRIAGSEKSGSNPSSQWMAGGIVGLCGIIALCWVILEHRTEAAQSPATRVVAFPADRTIGELYFISPVRPAAENSIPEEKPKYAGPARGEISVPAGKDLQLEFWGDSADMAALDGLKPDDLQSILVYGINMKDADLAHISHLTGLKRLYLLFGQFGDVALKHLGPLTSLQTISLVGAGFTDAGLVHLQKLASLRSLILHQTSIGDSGLANLAPLTSLESISFDMGSRVGGEGLAHLKALPQLRELRFGNRLNSAGMKNLKEIPTLEKLALSHPVQYRSSSSFTTPIGSSFPNGESFSSLAEMTNLKDLSLSGMAVLPSALDRLKSLPKLESLSLRECQLSLDMAGVLKEFPALKKLSLQFTDLSNDDLAHLRELPSFAKVSLSGMQKVNDDGLARLAGLTSVVSLGLTSSAITDAGLRHLTGLSSLTYLSINSPSITGAGVAQLAGLTSLNSLSLGGRAITDDGMAALEGMKSVGTLTLSGTAITDECLAHLSKMGSLDFLTLDHTKITGSGLARLKDLHLYTLNLEGCPLDKSSIGSLRELKSLKVINLAFTEVGDEEVLPLLELPLLYSLDLRGTRVSGGTIQKLKDASPRLMIQQDAPGIASPPPAVETQPAASVPSDAIGIEAAAGVGSGEDTHNKWTVYNSDGEYYRIVAVANPKEFPNQWWDPEGRPLTAKPAWERLAAHRENEPLLMIIECNFSTHDYRTHYTKERREQVKASRTGKRGLINAETGMIRFKNEKTDGRPNPDAEPWAIAVVDELNPGESLTVGYGAGPWRAAGLLRPDEPVSFEGVDYKLHTEQLKRNAGQKQSMFQARITHGFKADSEVSAIIVDKKGKQRPTAATFPDAAFVEGTTQVEQYAAYIEAEDFDHVILQVRPRKLHTFAPVADRPNSDEKHSEAGAVADSANGHEPITRIYKIKPDSGPKIKALINALFPQEKSDARTEHKLFIDGNDLILRDNPKMMARYEAMLLDERLIDDPFPPGPLETRVFDLSPRDAAKLNPEDVKKFCDRVVDAIKTFLHTGRSSKEWMDHGGRIEYDPGKRELSITARVEELDKVARYVESLPELRKSLLQKVLYLSKAKAEEMGAKLANVLGLKSIGEGSWADDTNERLFAMSVFAQFNALIVRYDNPARLAEVEDLIRRLDIADENKSQKQEGVEPVTRIYKIQHGSEVRIKALLNAEFAKESSDPAAGLEERGKLFIPGDELILHDDPATVAKYETLLQNEKLILEQSYSGPLSARAFDLAPLNKAVSDPAAVNALSERFTEAVATRLYAQTGRKKAAEQGKRLWHQPELHRLVVVDTANALDGVERYLTELLTFGGRKVKQKVFFPACTTPAELGGKLAKALGLAKDADRSLWGSSKPNELGIEVFDPITALIVRYDTPDRLKEITKLVGEFDRHEGDMRVKASDGRSFELLAVSRYPSGEGTWFTHDGTPLEGSIARILGIEKTEPNNGSAPDLAGLYEFVLIERGAPAEDTVDHNWSIIGSQYMGGPPSWKVTHEDEGRIGGKVVAWLAGFENDLKFATIHCKLVSGPWETQAKFRCGGKDDGGTLATSNGGFDVIFNSPQEKDGKTSIVVAHRWSEAPADPGKEIKPQAHTMRVGEEVNVGDLTVQLLRIEPGDPKDRRDEEIEIVIHDGDQVSNLTLRELDSVHYESCQITATEVEPPAPSETKENPRAGTAWIEFRPLPSKIEPDVRVMALLKNGTLIKADEAGGAAIHRMTSTTCIFPKSLSEIQEFQFQTCSKSETIEFRNISLRPGTKTRVSLKAEKSALPQSFEYDGRRP